MLGSLQGRPGELLNGKERPRGSLGVELVAHPKSCWRNKKNNLDFINTEKFPTKVE